jgi:HSP20 family protein
MDVDRARDRVEKQVALRSSVTFRNDQREHPMTKKTKSLEATVETTPALPDPFSRIGLTDWFDRWPELFARRWPESFHGLPFVDEGFRMEQFVEDDGTIVVRGELPGLDPDEDVTITLDADHLTIAGEREDRREENKNGGYRSEFRYGSFERTIRLPAGAKTDDVVATYIDGILEVRVPVDTETPAVTTIPISKK